MRDHAARTACVGAYRYCHTDGGSRCRTALTWRPLGTHCVTSFRVCAVQDARAATFRIERRERPVSPAQQHPRISSGPDRNRLRVRLWVIVLRCCVYLLLSQQSPLNPRIPKSPPFPDAALKVPDILMRARFRPAGAICGPVLTRWLQLLNRMQFSSPIKAAVPQSLP